LLTVEKGQLASTRGAMTELPKAVEIDPSCLR
jgi:hypothetical protein